MRTFHDDDGHPWQAALLEASYGNIELVFSRLGADDTLHTLLDAAHLREAEQRLAEADDAELRRLLSSAEPWRG